MGVFEGTFKWLKGLGFTMHEVMTGDHEFEPGCGPPGRHPMEFRVTWGPRSFGEWFDSNHELHATNELEGAVTVGGLCVNAPCQGTLKLLYLAEHKIRYTFEFDANGQRYRYVGEKVNIQPWNLQTSHTTCFGRLTEVATGKLVSTSVLHFRFATVPQFVTSLRLKGI